MRTASAPDAAVVRAMPVPPLRWSGSLTKQGCRINCLDTAMLPRGYGPEHRGGGRFPKGKRQMERAKAGRPPSASTRRRAEGWRERHGRDRASQSGGETPRATRRQPVADEAPSSDPPARLPQDRGSGQARAAKRLCAVKLERFGNSGEGSTAAFRTCRACSKAFPQLACSKRK